MFFGCRTTLMKGLVGSLGYNPGGIRGCGVPFVVVLVNGLYKKITGCDTPVGGKRKQLGGVNF